MSLRKDSLAFCEEIDGTNGVYVIFDPDESRTLAFFALQSDNPEYLDVVCRLGNSYQGLVDFNRVFDERKINSMLSDFLGNHIVFVASDNARAYDVRNIDHTTAYDVRNIDHTTVYQSKIGPDRGHWLDGSWVELTIDEYKGFFHKYSNEMFNTIKHNIFEVGKHLIISYHQYLSTHCCCCGTNEKTLVSNEQGEVACEICAENMSCSRCGRWNYTSTYRMLSITHNGISENICDCCLDECLESGEMSRCENCTSIHYTSNLASLEGFEIEGLYCQICRDHRVYNIITKPWDYVPDTLRFYEETNTYTTEEKHNTRYVGLELEFDDGSRSCFVKDTFKLSNTKGYDGLYHFMSDSSLDCGVELTTMPLEINYALKGFPIEFFTDLADAYDMRADNTDTCGFHIHVNKLSLGNTFGEQELTIAKVMLLFDKFYGQFRQFGRRENDYNASRWCSKPNANIERHEKDISTKISDSGNNHYKSINIQPTNTMEIRLWKGTIKPGIIRSTIDFTNAIIEVCMSSTLEEIYDMLWNDFLLASNKFIKLPITIDYLLSVSLIQPEAAKRMKCIVEKENRALLKRRIAHVYNSGC